MKVLVLVNYYLPGYKSGGPIKSISNLVDNIGDRIRFVIVTRDRDALDDKPYREIKKFERVKINGADVVYTEPGILRFFVIFRLLRRKSVDLLYINSVFSLQFSIIPLFINKAMGKRGKPVVLAPRGEFSGGALKLKGLKKKLFLSVAKLCSLYKDVVWQASSQYEEMDILRVMEASARHVRVVPNVGPRRDFSRTIKPMHSGAIYGGDLRIVFVGRIARIKNLEYALRRLKELAFPVSFHIYGPVRDQGYWSFCCRLIEKMPAHVCVQYKGEGKPENIDRIFAEADLLFLPTQGENYGHVIAEALMVGTPVLISDKTPWRGLADSGVGWDIPLSSSQDFVSALEECAGRWKREGIAWRHHICRRMQEWTKASGAVEANEFLLRDAAQRSVE